MKKLVWFLLLLVFTFNIYGQTIELNDEFWTNKGPNTAWVRSLAMAETNPNVLYLGTFAKGVYKSINGGESWFQCDTANLPTFDTHDGGAPNMPSWAYGNFHPVNAIAIDPTNSNHVWLGFDGKGIMESTNGGQSWVRAHESLPEDLIIQQISIDPNNPDDVLLATRWGTVDSDQLSNGGLYRTTNGGETWQMVDDVTHGVNFEATTIKRDTLNPGHIIVGVRGADEPDFFKGLLESSDNGETWQKLNGQMSFYDLSIDPGTNRYWSIAMIAFGDFVLIYSDDQGETWELPTAFEDPFNWITGLHTDSEFNMYIWRVDYDTTYSARTLFKSSDGGATWSPIDKFNKAIDPSRNFSFANSTASQKDNPDNFFFGNYFGVFHSEDGGEHTYEANKGLTNAYIEDIAVHPQNIDTVYARGQQGLWRTYDAGRNWTRLFTGGHVSFVKYDIYRPDTLFYGGRELYRSYDGGETFENIKEGIAGFISDIAVHPDSGNIVLVHSFTDIYSDFFYKSTDGGDTWIQTLHSTHNEGDAPILFNPSDPDTVYMGEMISTDCGSSWIQNTFDYDIRAVHPELSNVLYATEGYNLYKSNNYGSTFEFITRTELMVQNSLTFAENNPDYLFLCRSSQKVEYSLDEGITWTQLPGSYGFRTREVAPFVSKNRFYVAGFGDGVWVYDSTQSAIPNPITTSKELISISVAPNPFSNNLKIKFDNPNNQFIRINIYDLQGNLVNNLLNKRIHKGVHEINWDRRTQKGANIQMGLYFIHIQTEKSYTVKKALHINN